MNRKEALEILGFSPSDNPSEYEIRKAYSTEQKKSVKPGRNSSI